MLRSTFHRQAAAATTGLAVVALLAACSSQASDSGATAAKGTGAGGPVVSAAVSSAAAAQTTWPGPDTAIVPPPGKKVVAITCGSQGYGCVQGAQGVAAAGKAVGWNVQIVDGKGDPSVWNASVVQAVTDKADGIVLAAINPALVQDGLARARAAHIPVIVEFLPRSVAPGADGYVTTDHAAGGKTLADWIIADSDGKAKVLMLDEPEFPELVARGDAIRDELKTACPGCSIVDSAKFSIGTMAEQLPGLVTTALQSHSDISYVLAPFDSSGTFAAQGIRDAQRTGIALVSGEGDPDGLNRVRTGVQAADLATVPAWAGWAAVDQLARLFQHKPVQDYSLPQRLFTKSDAPPGSSGWPGDLDYAAKFRSIWGK